jgi:transglutaminase-like putative cysteine protease
MSPPRLLLGAGLLAWGWQGGLLAAALPMALALEAAAWVGWRYELSQRDFQRIADVCTALFVVVIGYQLVFTGFPQALFGILRWSPVAVFPLVLAQCYSSAGRVGLDALFLTLRGRRGEGAEPVPEADTRYPYFAVCLLAASAEPTPGPGLYLGVALLAGWALWSVRPAGGRGPLWPALFVLAVAGGYGVQAGLSRGQAWVEEAVLEWLAEWMDLEADPARSVTRLGAIGELKLSGKILLRVRPGPGVRAPLLLREAAYTVFHDGAWLAKEAKFEPLRAEGDGSTWALAPPGEGAGSLAVEMALRDGRGLLPLAPGTARIARLPALALERNRYGAVRALDAPGFLAFESRFRPDAERDAPAEFDLRVPPALEPVLARIVAELGLRELTAAGAVQALRAYFARGFGYSLAGGRRGGGERALEEFLLRSRRGHCEYFATATALLLRRAGIPARYAVGYSVQEYSPREEAYLVRKRHAHAWAIAWVDGAWRSVDTTPGGWGEIESREAPGWEPLLDLFSWLDARYSRWRWAPGSGEQGGTGWYVLAAALSVLLAWRLASRRRVAVAKARPAAQRGATASDSPFQRVVGSLERRRFAPAPGETLGRWLSRLGAEGEPVPERERLERLLALHQRWRFDPLGLPPGERGRFADEVEDWLRRHPGA